MVLLPWSFDLIHRDECIARAPISSHWIFKKRNSTVTNSHWTLPSSLDPAATSNVEQHGQFRGDGESVRRHSLGQIQRYSFHLLAFEQNVERRLFLLAAHHPPFRWEIGRRHRVALPRSVLVNRWPGLTPILTNPWLSEGLIIDDWLRDASVDCRWFPTPDDHP